MRTKINRYMLLVLLLFSFFQVKIYAQETKTRGLWLWGSTLSQQGSSAVVNKLKDNYVNKVYLLVKGTAGTKTSASLLTEFITMAHAAGIEVHLWYIVADDNVYVSAHPEAHQYRCPKPGTSNNPYPNTDSRVNLLYPGYKQYVLDNIKYFLDNFNCDGIHLDVIRYGHLVYSFDKNHLQKAASLGCDTLRLLNLFRNDYSNMTTTGFINLYISGDPDVVKWVTMRKNIVYDYIKSIKDLIQQNKPNAKLTAAFMPEGAYASDYADVHYSQNYTLNSPLLDEIAPMSYFQSYGQPPSWLKTVTQEAKKRVSSNCKIITGLQLWTENGDEVTPSELRYQVQFAFEGGADGVVGFNYAHASTYGHWTVLKEEFKKIAESEPKSITNTQMQEMCRVVSDSMTATTKVPNSVRVDSSTVVSAAGFYYMMVNYLRAYKENNNTAPAQTSIIKNIAGPANARGVQTGNRIMLADIFNISKTDADYIDLNKKLPDCSKVDTVEYDAPAMFWVYARTINWFREKGVMPNYATVKQCTGPATWTYDGSTSVKIDQTQGSIPSDFILYQNYPNPFNPETTIEYVIPSNLRGKMINVTLKVFDVLGREVATLVDELKQPGKYSSTFYTLRSSLPSGVYFYRLTSGNNTLVRKMMLLR
ncbi:MAG: T9SS type A sorting domain-containing protein [Bacteroidota bacterium]